MTNNSLTFVEESTVTLISFGPFMISYNIILIVQWTVHVVVCQIIAVFGTMGNIINIVCFVKQGFRDSVNISLLALAISDTGCLVPLIWANICYIPAFREPDMPFEPLDVQYVTGLWPHIIFSRVTCWITVFITLERCLCVTLPFKVKTIFTRKRVIAIILSIYCIHICSSVPAFYANQLSMKFSYFRNKTIFGLVFSKDRDLVEDINFSMNNVCFQFTAFVALTIFTITLVVTLKGKATWREKAFPTGQSDSSSSREQKVAKMVIVISSLFIASFVPVCATVVAMFVEPGFSLIGKYYDLFIIVGSFNTLLESASSAINIFIYLYMSSKYRTTFRKLFHIEKSKE